MLELLSSSYDNLLGILINTGIHLMKKFLVTILLLFVSMVSFSEDIELYISDALKTAAKKTQVLIVLDDSGSMTTEETVKFSYDPTVDYPTIPGRTKFSSKYLYYNKGDGIPSPDQSSENRRFLASLNGCDSSKASLAQDGFYTAHIRYYKFVSNNGQWKGLPRYNGSNIGVLDCEDDVLNNNANNADGVDVGFPVNYLGTSSAPVYFTDAVADSNASWGDKYVTLYTDNYLRWFLGDTVKEEKRTRMAMAIESINDVIKSAPSIDFGLQVFNYNDGDSSNSGNGGRIVAGIREMTEANETTLLNLVNNQVSAQGGTPLCETLYEASRYFSGDSVEYGDDDIDVNYWGYQKNKPPRDTTIELLGKYVSPFSGCSDKVYVILITDGEPQNDHHADSSIESLSSLEDGQTINFSGSKYNYENSQGTLQNNYLAGLAEWMSNRDLNSKLKGKQTADIYTIGFSDGAADAAPLLKETAALGGGKYFRATDSAQLTAALVGALEDLAPNNDSLTSASVAANNFDRTETLNSVYYAMFQPDNGPRWQGNLKKYKVINSKQLGMHGKAALDEESGQFSEDVTSYWSPANSKDGDVVAEGGVAEMLRKKTNRVIYSDIGSGGALELLTEAQANVAFGGADELASKMDVNEEDIGTYLNWAMGKNVDNVKSDDGTVPTMRPDVFGDPLHSKPLVINYGTSIRVVIGTNAGSLHMFQDNNKTVDENWAFMPKEFFSNIKRLRDNFATDDKVYGIDGSITSYVKDINGDGIINGSDKVWVFFGLRRGGTSYYGLDISIPGAPGKLWHIDATTAGFGELGQSWSQPKIGYSKLKNSDESTGAEPVLFFGGGYDAKKDAKTPGAFDGKGRAIYMVDAASGTLKWSVAPEGGTTTFPGTDSIPSSIGLLDSDGDGLTDRLYTGDTGGNVWRIDMPGAAPNDSENPWTIFKLAELGGTTNESDLRFFNEPSIVRTFISETIQTQEKDEDGNVVKDENGNEITINSHQEKPYDAILIGSGDRSNPIGIDTDDSFFMLKDSYIKTQSFYSAVEPKIPTTILKTNLYDYTTDPFIQADTTQKLEDLAVAVSQKSGWHIDFNDPGEKNTAEAIVINGIVYFTTFVPADLDPSVIHCEQPNGKGFLYAVDLTLGIAIYNWKEGDSDAEAERRTEVNEQFLGAPTLIVVPDDDGDPDTDDDSKGNIIVGRKIIPVGFTLQTMRTYLYISEDQ